MNIKQYIMRRKTRIAGREIWTGLTVHICLIVFVEMLFQNLFVKRIWQISLKLIYNLTDLKICEDSTIQKWNTIKRCRIPRHCREVHVNPFRKPEEALYRSSLLNCFCEKGLSLWTDYVNQTMSFQRLLQSSLNCNSFQSGSFFALPPPISRDIFGCHV